MNYLAGNIIISINIHIFGYNQSYCSCWIKCKIKMTNDKKKITHTLFEFEKNVSVSIKTTMKILLSIKSSQKE